MHCGVTEFSTISLFTNILIERASLARQGSGSVAYYITSSWESITCSSNNPGSPLREHYLRVKRHPREDLLNLVFLQYEYFRELLNLDLREREEAPESRVIDNACITEVLIDQLKPSNSLSSHESIHL